MDRYMVGYRINGQYYVSPIIYSTFERADQVREECQTLSVSTEYRYFTLKVEG